MFPTFPIGSGVILTPDTYIDIRVDGTSSLATSFAAIQSAVQTLLKPELLPYYNNDSAWYDAHVTTFQTANSNAAERPLYELCQRNASPPGGDRLIVLWLCDESTPYGCGNGDTFTPATARTTEYNADIATLRAYLAAREPGYYKGAFVQMDTEYSGPYEVWLDAIRYGQGNYAGAYGLSDKNEFTYAFGYDKEQTAAYYLEMLREVLNSMGVSF